MRWLLIGTAVLALAACSQAPQRESATADGDMVTTDASTPDQSSRAVPSPPSIGVTAAPGVAFNYHYAFRLPTERVAAAQEAHAQACEKLGVARCRITGMRYRLIGENAVEAQLAFKLDPAIARLFGKQGIDVVRNAEGALVDAEITGTDAGANIARLATERDRAASERRRIDAELAKPGRSSAERTQLQARRDEVDRAVAAATDAGAAERESLATTPMVFDYGSGEAIRGFDASAPVKSAASILAGSAQVTLAFVLGALALLGPPGLVLALGWLLWVRLGRPIARRRRAASPPQA